MNKELMKQAGFREEVKLVEQGFCPLCKEKVRWKILKMRFQSKNLRLAACVMIVRVKPLPLGKQPIECPYWGFL